MEDIFQGQSGKSDILAELNKVLKEQNQSLKEENSTLKTDVINKDAVIKVYVGRVAKPKKNC